MPPLPSSLFMHELARRWSQLRDEQQAYERAAGTVGALGEQQYGEQSKQAAALGAMLQGAGRPLEEVSDLPSRLRQTAELAYGQEEVATERAAREEERKARLKTLLQSMKDEAAGRKTVAEILGRADVAKMKEMGAMARTRLQTAEGELPRAQAWRARHYLPQFAGGGPGAITPKDVLKTTLTQLGTRHRSAMKDLADAEKRAVNFYTQKVVETPQLQQRREEAMAANQAYLKFMYNLVQNQPGIGPQFADVIQELLDIQERLENKEPIEPLEGEEYETEEMSEEEEVGVGFY